MAKFKVVKEFVMNGIVQKEGMVIDLDHQHQQLKSIKENIVKVPDITPVGMSPVAAPVVPPVVEPLKIEVPPVVPPVEGSQIA